MPIKIKVKEAPVVEAVDPVTEPDTAESLLVELGEIAPDVEFAKEIIAKEAKLRKNFMDAVLNSTNVLNSDPIELVIDGVQANISPCAKKRVIKDLDAAKDMLGEELFMEIAKIGLKELDDYLNPLQRAEVIETTQDGSRSLKIKVLTIE